MRKDYPFYAEELKLNNVDNPKLLEKDMPLNNKTKKIIKDIVSDDTLHEVGYKNPEIYELAVNRDKQFWIEAIINNVNAFWYAPLHIQNNLEVITATIENYSELTLYLHEKPIIDTWKELDIFSFLLNNNKKLSINKYYCTKEFALLISTISRKLFHHLELNKL